jgi:stage V sporulation protein D (sporulation-specific penicillin-binding protein)
MDLATNSFGQNYNCTMVQLAAAFASVINGGFYYDPHVVKQILNDNGSVIEKNDGVLVRETVSATTSDVIRKALVRTVAEGTGKAAQVAGYEVGGKTGTAEKYPRKQGNYVVSFCGFAPADNPQVLVYVVIDEPNVEDQAHSTFASEVFSKVMGDILPYMNIFPTIDLPESDSSIQEQLPKQEGITENVEETDETSENGEEVKNGEGAEDGEETVPVRDPSWKLPYEDEEYVPQDSEDDSYEVPGEMPGEVTAVEALNIEE